MFEVGTLLICNKSGRYIITNETTLVVVTNNISNNEIEVEVVAMSNEYQENKLERRFDVESDYFEEITTETYFRRFPNAIAINNLEEYILSLKAIVEKSAKEKEAKEKAKKDVSYKFSEGERENLVKEISDLLDMYNYHPTEEGVNAILNEWAFQKKDIINLFKKHPNYNGKYQIAFDVDYERTIDAIKIRDFLNWIIKEFCERNRVVIDGIPFEVANNETDKYISIISKIRSIYEDLTGEYIDVGEIPKDFAVIQEHNIEYFLNKFDFYNKLLADYRKKTNMFYYCDKIYHLTNKNHVISCNLEKLFDILSDIKSSFVTKDMSDSINEMFPEVKAVPMQKISRIVNKICVNLGIDKYTGYNKEFAKFSDAVNPLSIKRHTVISCHPIDYLTMSFGNSWSSCHTIDKNNIREMENHYNGMYSGGTMSYMLDGTSVVFYTVDGKYEGNYLELEPKINRNMFHIGEEKIVQGRVYPQTNDSNNGIYEKFRNIMQKVIADCYNVPNMWKLKKGTSACNEVIISDGVHYRDYQNFYDCNVSYLKHDDTINVNDIRVGHNPICPCCGKEHNRKDCIECSNCYCD